MKIEFNYGKKLAVLPASAFDWLERASKLDLKVLFMLASTDTERVSSSDIAEKLATSEERVMSALKFWSAAEIIEFSDAAEAVKVAGDAERVKKEAGATIIRRSDELPSYTTEELTHILEKRSEASYLLDESQEIMGKIFNTKDINLLLGMMDYLSLDHEYITSLLKYCVAIGKKSLHYAEKLAISMVEEGIEDAETLKARLAELEAIVKNEGRVRKLFGMKSRAMTTKEKKCVALWFGKFGYDMEIVTRAYEITIANTNEASLPYTHAILERWNTEGLNTLEDIDRSIEERKAQKQENSDNTDGSFDTDDFFEAALKRSYKKT